MVLSFIRTWNFITSHPLASRDKRGAMGRWLHWQLGSRLHKDPIVVPFIEDAVLVVEAGMSAATGNIYCGLQEFEDMAFVMHVLRQDDLFVDVGANIGSYTVLAAKVVGANCLSLEPVPETFSQFQRNIRINNLGLLVEPIQCAAGSGTAELCFSADRGATNQIVEESYRGKKISVPVRALDDILRERSTFLWKIDVEGFEREVLMGSKRALLCPTLHAVLLEGDDQHIASMMETAGFVRGSYDPFGRKIRVGNSGKPSNNHLWLRDVEFVAKRCFDARQIVVLGETI